MTDDKNETSGDEAAADAITIPGDDKGSALDDAIQKAQEQEVALPHTVVAEEDLPLCCRKITFEVAREDWEQRLAKLFKDWKRDAAVEGFRKGHVPVKLLQRRFEREAGEDIAEKAVPTMLAAYAKDKEVDLVGETVIDEVVAEAGQPSRIVVTVERKPVIEAKNYTGLDIEVVEPPMGDISVDDEIKRLQAQSGNFHEVDGPFADTMGVVVDAKAVDPKGKTVLTEANWTLDQPAASLPAAVIEALKGKKAGDTVEVVAESWRGTPKAKYTVALKAVKEFKLPTIDDDWAKDLGFDDLAALRKNIETDAAGYAERRHRSASADALILKIVESNTVEIPASVERNMMRQLLREDMEFRYRTGMPSTRQMVARTRNAYEERLRSDAGLRVKAFFLLEAIGKQEKIEPTEEEINTELDRIGAEEGRKGLAIRAGLEKRNQWTSFVDDLRMQKIEKFLLDGNKFKFVAPPPPPAVEPKAAE